MSITAKVIEDSISPKARRLTTFELRYPRFIHAEFMTHRHFSRNASSSRAIPVERQIQSILDDTAMPIHWGKNQAGMQAHEENDAAVQIVRKTEHYGHLPKYVTAQEAWEEARDRAVEMAIAFHDAGYHKQVVNRILEPFSHITVVCTSTQYDNFFGLRRHPDAQPEIKALADAMYEAMEESTPTVLHPGEWHLPYVTDELWDTIDEYGSAELTGQEITDMVLKCSVARCARVSYKTHDGGTPTIESDLALYDRLVGAQPLHASPAEHQATPDTLIFNSAELPDYEKPHLHGNLSGGWIQYRKTLPHECIDNWEDPLNQFD